MSTRRYSVVFISLIVIATTNLIVEGQSLSWSLIAPGVNYAVADGALGEDVFIGMGGLNATQEMVDSWVGALYAARLHTLGVRHVYSVKGPSNVYYAGREIGTLELARHLVLLIQSHPASNQIIVAAHSAGSNVAHVLFQDLYEGAGADSTNSTDEKIEYFLLDYAHAFASPDVPLTTASVNRLGHIYGVYAFIPSLNLYSFAPSLGIVLVNRYGAKGSGVDIDASESGCLAAMCLHMTMINRKPYQQYSFDARDYAAINPDHPVQTAYLDSVFATNIAMDDAPPLPTEYALHGNYPNPFNPTTTISYALPQAADVSLTVYDVLGRAVRELASGTRPAGTYEIYFDATGLPSGVYFYRLHAKDYVETRRMVVVT